MRVNRRFAVRVCALLLLASQACGLRDAPPTVVDVKLYRDEGMSAEAYSFSGRDTVYVTATINGFWGRGKVRGRLVIVDARDQRPGPVPGLEMTLELPGSPAATFSYGPPSPRWPPGRYQIEVTSFDAAGAQKSQKSAEFIIS